ncbi:hypothetical protein GWC77_27990 [Paraburkholderia sp. NMBU_R16]|uniref:hypothetical protein n=1 Tax=Paraburkholderia sp. NMBU_R16 TaxID=2698676 RepID=UPI0015642CCE|nr:hypothetical protein [Paraburkholderia sp. NMBU_R16]NRO99687.1 hypothetical protein [Paraburkholderia sp. NMBU_R16]
MKGVLGDPGNVLYIADEHVEKMRRCQGLLKSMHAVKSILDDMITDLGSIRCRAAGKTIAEEMTVGTAGIWVFASFEMAIGTMGKTFARYVLPKLISSYRLSFDSKREVSLLALLKMQWVTRLTRHAG